MKDFKFILSKLIKKQMIPLLMITLIMFILPIFVLNRSDVYASGQLAKVGFDVNMVGDDVTNIASDSAILSDFDTSNVNLSNICVELDYNTRIECLYTIENLSSNECLVSLNLKNAYLENILVEYQIGEEVGSLNSLGYSLLAGESVNIKITISIENVARDAALSGELCLTLCDMGEN